MRRASTQRGASPAPNQKAGRQDSEAAIQVDSRALKNQQKTPAGQPLMAVPRGNMFGSACWTRTSDPMINSHLLYRLS